MECVAPFSLIHPHKCISGKREQSILILLSIYQIVEESMMEEETTTKEISPSRVKAIEGHSDRVFFLLLKFLCRFILVIGILFVILLLQGIF